MAAIKQHRTHDMVQLRVSYDKGTSLLLTCSRGGESIRMKPEDFAVEVALGSVIAHVVRKMRSEPDGDLNFGIMMDRLEQAAKDATSYGAFADRACIAMGVPAGLPPPARTGTPPTTTLATVKAGRSQVVTIAFPTGETVELKISGASSTMRSDPAVCAISDRVMRFAMGAGSLGYAPDFTARAIAEHAKRSPDLLAFARGLTVTIFHAVNQD